MARMRWMHDASGRPTVVCLRCDREAPADPTQTFYCFCRSGAGLGETIERDLAPSSARSAA